MKRVRRLLFIGLLILLVGYLSTALFGGIFTRFGARMKIERYADYIYPQTYIVKDFTYNFLDRYYVTKIVNKEDGQSRSISYYRNKNQDGFSAVISDQFEEEKEIELITKEVEDICKDISFDYEELSCNVQVSINANQKFKSIDELERYDIADVILWHEDPISRDEFSDLLRNIVFNIKSNMYYQPGSVIRVEYVYWDDDKYYSFSYTHEYNIYHEKEYIMNDMIVED